ncbi:MAG: hypothetical protein KDD60_10245 [Bdellovibrionales bacterium]|nr:hypothetical protein [Bdellovibrionales bacterium]
MKSPPELPGMPNDAIEYSHLHERRLVKQLHRVVQELDPVAMLDRLVTLRPKVEDSLYLQRLLRESSPRSLLPYVMKILSSLEVSCSWPSLQRKDIPAIMEASSLPIHPKLEMLQQIVEHSPALQSGGRVLVIGSSPVVNKYIASVASAWECVDRSVRAIEPQGISRDDLRLREGAFEKSNGKRDLLILTPDNLRNLVSRHRGASGISFLNCATVVVHHLESASGLGSIRRGDPLLPKKHELPTIRTKQVLRLALESEPKWHLVDRLGIELSHENQD